MTFVDAVIDGEATVEQIDDWIDRWHDDETISMPLHTFLGMTWDEYSRWLGWGGNKELRKLIALRKAGRV